MPPFVPFGWEKYVGNLIRITTPTFFRSAPAASAVYLGNGAFLTAAHNNPPPDAFDVRDVYFSELGLKRKADLLLYRSRNIPRAPALDIAKIAPLPGAFLVHAGIGRHRLESERFAPGIYLFPASLEENFLAGRNFLSPLFQFKSIPFASGKGPVESREGDSGGLILGWDSVDRKWELVGMLAYRSESIETEVMVAAIDLTPPEIRNQIMSYVFSPTIAKDNF